MPPEGIPIHSGALNRKDQEVIIAALEQRIGYWKAYHAGKTRGNAASSIGRKASIAQIELYTGVLNRFKMAYGWENP